MVSFPENVSEFFMRESRKARFGPSHRLHLFLSFLVLSLHILIFTTLRFQFFEYPILDAFFKQRPQIETNTDIVMIKIDDSSLRTIGNFPWPEHYYAEMIKTLDEWEARAIIFDVFMDEPLTYDEELRIKDVIGEETPFYLSALLQPEEEKKIWVHSLPVVLAPEGQGMKWAYPDPDLVPLARAVGHVNTLLDQDSRLRRAPAFVAHGNTVYPELMLAVSSDLTGSETPSRYNFNIPADEGGNVLVNYAGDWEEIYPHYSYADIIRSAQAIVQGQKPMLDPRKFKNKICLIGVTATPSQTTEGNAVIPGADRLGAHAHLLNSFMTKQYIRPYNLREGLFCFIGIALVASLFFLFMRGVPLLVTTICLSVAWIVFAFFLFCRSGWWLPVIQPILLIISLFVLAVIYHQIVSAKEQRRLYDLATRDGLTGLYVIRHFREILNRVVGEASQTGEAISCILLDIDNFKPINDTYGHPAGDEVLKRIADVIYACLRTKRKLEETDYVGRYGGEEFIILLRNSDLKKTTTTVAERIRAAIERKEIKWEGKVIPVTVSVGVATLRKKEQVPDAMVLRADEALYHAKRTGKNRVSTEEDL